MPRESSRALPSKPRWLALTLLALWAMTEVCNAGIIAQVTSDSKEKSHALSSLLRTGRSQSQKTGLKNAKREVASMKYKLSKIPPGIKGTGETTQKRYIWNTPEIGNSEENAIHSSELDAKMVLTSKNKSSKTGSKPLSFNMKITDDNQRKIVYSVSHHEEGSTDSKVPSTGMLKLFPGKSKSSKGSGKEKTKHGKDAVGRNARESYVRAGEDEICEEDETTTTTTTSKPVKKCKPKTTTTTETTTTTTSTTNPTAAPVTFAPEVPIAKKCKPRTTTTTTPAAGETTLSPVSPLEEKPKAKKCKPRTTTTTTPSVSVTNAPKKCKPKTTTLGPTLLVDTTTTPLPIQTNSPKKCKPKTATLPPAMVTSAPEMQPSLPAKKCKPKTTTKAPEPETAPPTSAPELLTEAPKQKPKCKPKIRPTTTTETPVELCEDEIAPAVVTTTTTTVKPAPDLEWCEDEATPAVTTTRAPKPKCKPRPQPTRKPDGNIGPAPGPATGSGKGKKCRPNKRPMPPPEIPGVDRPGCKPRPKCPPSSGWAPSVYPPPPDPELPGPNPRPWPKEDPCRPLMPRPCRPQRLPPRRRPPSRLPFCRPPRPLPCPPVTRRPRPRPGCGPGEWNPNGQRLGKRPPRRPGVARMVANHYNPARRRLGRIKGYNRNF